MWNISSGIYREWWRYSLLLHPQWPLWISGKEKNNFLKLLNFQNVSSFFKFRGYMSFSFCFIKFSIKKQVMHSDVARGKCCHHLQTVCPFYYCLSLSPIFFKRVQKCLFGKITSTCFKTNHLVSRISHNSKYLLILVQQPAILCIVSRYWHSINENVFTLSGILSHIQWYIQRGADLNEDMDIV